MKRVFQLIADYWLGTVTLAVAVLAAWLLWRYV